MRIYNEVEKAEHDDGKATTDNCHITNSILLENFRVFPVADTLPHQAIADTYLDGYLIEKNSGIQGSLTGIMNNPKYFKDPERFIPDRFVKNGKFEKDIRVCPFSLGLRNCIGKQLARSEYFKFTIEVIFSHIISVLKCYLQIVKNFKLVKTSGSLDPARHGALLMPKPMQIKFLPR